MLCPQARTGSAVLTRTRVLQTGDSSREAIELSLITWCALIDSGFGRGTTRAEDAQGTPTRSHISPSLLVYEEQIVRFKLIPRNLMCLDVQGGGGVEREMVMLACAVALQVCCPPHTLHPTPHVQV